MYKVKTKDEIESYFDNQIIELLCYLLCYNFDFIIVVKPILIFLVLQSVFYLSSWVQIYIFTSRVQCNV